MTNTPKPQANKTIDEILLAVVQDHYVEDMNRCLEKGKYCDSIVLAKQQIQAHYLKEFLDMIGEDEKIFMEDSIASTHFKEGSNHRIKKQRKAAKERFS